MAKVTDLSRAAGAAVAELVDAMDSKSIGRKAVRVRVSPAAPLVRDAHDSPVPEQARYGAGKIHLIFGKEILKPL
ncbi:MAG: hypothetical protein UY62_C0041G0007 [Parcubacteria group bacterium GW2011_GWF2_50_9]|nr:MAG: hypothetical protein UY62_C0041G0007 [Parcubacteria group bacterium GW2011_GWF2_50_9]